MHHSGTVQCCPPLFRAVIKHSMANCTYIFYLWQRAVYGEAFHLPYNSKYTYILKSPGSYEPGLYYSGFRVAF